MKEMVNHPAHYNKEGRKECIQEMVEIFGVEEARIFCKLNVYKYKYRHDLKNGEEDLRKAENYTVMYRDLGGNTNAMLKKEVSYIADR